MKVSIHVLVLVALLNFLACGADSRSAQLELKVVHPHQQTLKRTVEIVGVLAPQRSATILAKVVGQAKRVPVDVGDSVRAGDLLLEIESKELAAQLILAEATVTNVQQQAAQALVGIDTAKTNYDQAKRYLDRLNSLEDRSALSKSQLDDTQSKVELTQRTWEGAKLQYKTLSEAGLGQAQAQVDVVRSQMANTLIRSPIDGVITNRNINPGELTSTSTALLNIADIHQLKLQGTVSQDVVSLLHRGASVSILVDGLSETLVAKISQIGPIAATSGQYFPVIMTIDQPGSALAGMTARAQIDVQVANALTVPLSAIRTDAGHSWIFLTDSGRAEKTAVVLGLQNGREVQILSGLSAFQTVAASNVSLLADGNPIKAQFE